MNIISWFSCGVSSAVATKIALKKYPQMKILYIDIEEHHPDNKRFLKDCEQWFGQKIEVLISPYKSIYKVFKQFQYINGVRGAKCTQILKKRVRQEYELDNIIDGYVWGFDCSARERERASRMTNNYSNYKHIFPLIENDIGKENAHYILSQSGIEKPMMYKLGYNNNNCIGCVKGGMGYWNKIRQDFPDVYNRMSAIEREVGASCINGYYLDELPKSKGYIPNAIVEDCDLLCQASIEELKGAIQ